MLPECKTSIPALLGFADPLVVQVAGPLLLLDLEMQVFPQEPRDPIGFGILANVVKGRPRDDQRRALPSSIRMLSTSSMIA